MIAPKSRSFWRGGYPALFGAGLAGFVWRGTDAAALRLGAGITPAYARRWGAAMLLPAEPTGGAAGRAGEIAEEQPKDGAEPSEQ